MITRGSRATSEKQKKKNIHVDEPPKSKLKPEEEESPNKLEEDEVFSLLPNVTGSPPKVTDSVEEEGAPNVIPKSP
jgi:hypothetical protein